jgi:hypothetical protein
MWSIVLAGGLILGTAACSDSDSEASRIMPEATRGVWETNDARYADRKFEILDEALLFHTEARAFDPYLIHEIQTEVDEDGTRYIIEHSGAEMGSMTLTLFFYQGDSTLVFENQPFIVWRKVSSGS